MRFMLQFGYGMMGHCRDMAGTWNSGGVILSPRDLEPEQLERLAESIRKTDNSEVLLDPQWYRPTSDHLRLNRHDFFPSDVDTGDLWGTSQQAQLLQNLVNRNTELGTSTVIAPAEHLATAEPQWLDSQEQVIADISSMTEVPVLATLPLGSDALRSSDMVGNIIEAIEQWPVAGAYVVLEHPGGSYFVDDPVWMSNALDLIAGIRLLNRTCVLGYANQQMLTAACASCSALATGTWMNTRAFPPAKFEESLDDEVRRRATWYYSSRTLSEFKLPFLDFAQQANMLESLRTPPEFSSGVESVLFDVGQPSASGFTERDSFRHFLHVMRAQAEAAEYASFDEAVAGERARLDSAEALLDDLAQAGISGQGRDFGEIVDVNRAAIARLETDRGGVLRRRWTTLSDGA